MTKQQILQLEDKVVTLEQLEAIEESVDVEKVENLGRSGLHPHMSWCDIKFYSGETITVYF